MDPETPSASGIPIEAPAGSPIPGGNGSLTHPTPTLSDILDGHVDTFGGNDALSQLAANYAEDMSCDEEETVEEKAGNAPAGGKAKLQGFCVECEDQPAVVFCEQCADDYCEVCFHAQHRKGSRKKHVTKPLAPLSVASKTTAEKAPSLGVQNGKAGGDGAPDVVFVGPQPALKSNVGDWFLERSKFIPVRLTLNERKYLRLLEAALTVSDYTDKIDILSYTSKSKRIVAQIKELCAILSGLVLAADYKAGQSLFQDRDFEHNEEFFQRIFELGRRHKIMNPEKMRSTYGKLVYMLQDSQIPEVKEMLSFSCVDTIKTVYNTLAAHDGLRVLEDDLITVATQEILSEGKSRHQVQGEIKQKERAIEQLSRKYAHSELSTEMIKQCLYSIGDNHAFLRTNRDPCDKMIAYLKRNFNPEKSESGYSLAIQSGRGGARLSHDHSKQYHYVHQSLTLWREILHDFFMLWGLAEQDLLNENNPYRLRDTGQGLNRVQSAPKVSRAMHTILHRAQQRVGYWVGSSVIHLGDHNVPNALMFIDKYTQIYRILLPMVNCIDQLDHIVRDAGVARYVETTFGGVEKLRKDILCDFFRHAFDGSGADNFFDAGSCIDGRLTSAWNWCSNLEKKPFFPVFLLTGFVGFDGQW
ncbi:hypothetical protein HK104_005858 [Borealophlyctis nickersoniae]|nr:hypothetical protein HK104_005858 [Borealophlyctis nickersoniae]